jgi:Mlc titration factor MtfA (ptsG expression regulator)
MFDLFRGRRRRRLLERTSIPEESWSGAVADVPLLQRLDGETLGRLRGLALLFLHEKRIEAAGDLELDDRKRVRIAALACLPILELGIDAYSTFSSVIVYPGEFLVRDREYVDEDGVAHVGDDVLSGEAWEQGPVVLAWSEIEASGIGEGFNVVAHEFTHKLDLLDGAIDGIPPLHSDMSSADWTAAFRCAYESLRAQLDRDEDTWLDPYAAEDPAEFLAVCAEMFFDVPEELAREYPAVYAQLRAFFRQDPAR